MRSTLRNAIYTLLLATVLAAVPSMTPAQCTSILGLGGVSALSSNPFQAEIQQTILFHDNAAAHSTRRLTEQVARDADGRVRVDRSGGKFKVQTGSDEGAEEERHFITICDPVAQQSILLDTLNKTATTQKLGAASGSLLRSPSAGAPGTNFCARQLKLGAHLPGAELQNLGHKNIEGLDAEGVQEKRPFPAISNGETAAQVSVSEVWCSEELGAVMLRTSGTEAKGSTMTTAMTSIQRGEPDAALFQIPPDYRIVEKVNEPGVRPGLGVIGTLGLGSSGVLTPVPAAIPAAKPE